MRAPADYSNGHVTFSPYVPVKHRAIAIGILCMLAGAPAARAEVPPELRVKILLTALGFNRTLASSDALEIVLGVVGDCPTIAALRLAEGKKVNGKAIRVVTASETTYAYFDRSGINVVYFCQIDADQAKTVGKAAARLGATVMADDPDLVAVGAMMGVREQDGHPKLLLNMKLAKLAQIEFDPRILGAAEVVSE